MDAGELEVRPALCLSPESELPSLAHNCITYRDGAKVDVAWTRYQFGEICWLLLNGNDFKFFLAVYQDAQGNAQFTKNKLAGADKRAEWAWNTITGKATKQKTGIGFYPTNIRGESRWGAMDFDCHAEGEQNRAHDLAFAAFRVLELHCQHRLILGTSGPSGGWHLFIFADGFYPVAEWIRFLQEVALRTRAPLKKGVCEIFPSSTRGHHGGGGIRAPGTLNPKNGDFGRLFLNSVTPALSHEGSTWESKRELMSSLYHATSQEKKAQLHDKSTQTGNFDLLRRSTEFAITAAGTRSEQLKKLIGETFRSYGQEVIRQVAQRQHETATPKPKATLEEHMAEFEKLWTFFAELWRAELGRKERSLFNQLATPAERDAFRIIHGWSRLAADNGESSFPVSCTRLGLRIGITWQGLSKMRDKFTSSDIIHLTAPHRVNISSARFQWTASQTA